MNHWTAERSLAFLRGTINSQSNSIENHGVRAEFAGHVAGHGLEVREEMPPSRAQAAEAVLDVGDASKPIIFNVGESIRPGRHRRGAAEKLRADCGECTHAVQRTKT